MNEKRDTTFAVRTYATLKAKVEAALTEHEQRTGETITLSRFIELAVEELIAKLEAERGEPYRVKPRKPTGQPSPLSKFLKKREE